ncbi:hypothetical protein K7432_012483, partial [Basidiobolus ranarum]
VTVELAECVVRALPDDFTNGFFVALFVKKDEEDDKSSNIAGLNKRKLDNDAEVNSTSTEQPNKKKNKKKKKKKKSTTPVAQSV